MRPVIWFPTAYTIVIIVHEFAHALTSSALGFSPKLYHFWVDSDFTNATIGEKALVGIAAPIVSLLFGLACALVYRRWKATRAGLPFLYLATSGVTNFFGNLMSAAFLGDFSNATLMLGLSPPLRYAASAVGAVMVALVLFVTGKELWRWVPQRIEGTAGALAISCVPALIGVLVIIGGNPPTPMGPAFATARVVEGSLWLFAAAGALVARRLPRGHESRLRFHWLDAAAVAAVVLAVGFLARGVSF